MANKFKGFNSAFFVFHLLIVLLSYSIYLAPNIAPTTFSYFGFVPIFFPVILLVNLLLVIVLFLKGKSVKWLFLLFFIGLLPPLQKSYQFFGNKVEVEADFKLITFNVNHMRKEGIDDFLLVENADVVVFQEGTNRRRYLKKLNEGPFKDFYSETDLKNQIFSRYPIIEFKPIFQVPGDLTTGAVYADIDTGKDTIRIINVHLGSMGVDKELVTGEVNDLTEVSEGSKVVKNRMISGFLKHQQQIQLIMPYIQHSPYPVILAGDFNAVPNSYEYRQITYWLKDTYLEVGRSPGTSFHDYKYPIRIDYVFHSDEFLPVSYKVKTNLNLSDHYPVVTQFKLP